MSLRLLCGQGGTLDVGNWHKADIFNALTNVRFWGQSRHGADLSVCPLMTQSGHRSSNCGARVSSHGIAERE
jgi:hypothetical protein